MCPPPSQVIRALCSPEELRRRASSFSSLDHLASAIGHRDKQVARAIANRSEQVAIGVPPREVSATDECSPSTVVAERKWWHRTRAPLGQSRRTLSNALDGTPEAAGRAGGVAWYDESSVTGVHTPIADLQQTLSRVRLTD